MENKLRNLFQYSRDAVVCVRDRHILYANSSAEELFRRDISGESASRHIPAQILDYGADSFVSSAEIAGHICTVLAAHFEDVLVLTLQPEPLLRQRANILSDGLAVSMAAALGNIGISVNTISRILEQGEKQNGKQEDSVWEAEGGKLGRYMSILQHSYYTLKRLIGNMSSALAFDTGTAAFLPRSTDLALLCSDLVSTCSVLLRGRARISFSTTLGELIANVDPNLIERLLLNLISNSSAHTPPDGEISLGLKVRGNRAIISVDDNGSGMPPRILSRPFKSYELSDDDLSREPSGGLGLAICRSIVELHGGSIIIDSREGEGTRVRVMLPLDGYTFASNSRPFEPGMDNILTELSGVLTSSDYKRQFLD